MDAETTPVPAGQPAPNKPPRRWGMALVVLLLLGAGGAWLVLLGKSTLHSLDGTLANLAAESSANASRLQGLQQRLDALAGEQAQASATRGALEAQLSQLEGRIAALPKSQDAAWAPLRLAEADALLLLATQRLELARDVAGAAAALGLAAARLGEELPALRSALLADAAGLQEFRDTDATALANELGAFADAAAGWPVRLGTPVEDTAPAPVADGWRGLLAALWHDLLGLVEIRAAGDGSPDPMLAPERTALLHQQLALELMTARIAVLARDNPTRNAALQSARSLLAQSFEVDHDGVRGALSRIEGLAKIDLKPALPSLEASQAALAAARTGTTP